MIVIDFACDSCKNQLPNIDGWKCACKAFPDGIPNEYFTTKLDPKEMPECNNGIGFEPKNKI